jgi:CHASE2 domain-containing sensor protein
MWPEFRRRIGENWRSGLVGIALSIAVALFLWIPRLSSYSDQLSFIDKLSFDWLYALRLAGEVSGVQIIEMNQKSFRVLEQNPTLDWDRALHARLLRKLKNDGARLVVFNVFFDAGGRKEADDELADAMRAHGRVVIATDLVPLTRAEIVGSEPVFPTERLKLAAAGIGLAAPDKDTDGVVRRQFVEMESHESLSWVAARVAGARSLSEIHRLQPRWLNYYGPVRSTLPRIGYSEALEQPALYFHDKYVFIGGAPRIKKPGQQSDTFRTPYTLWDGQEASGVDLLALNFLNILRGDGLSRCPAWIEFLLIVLVGLGVGFGFSVLRPATSAVVALLLATGVAGTALVLHGFWHVWFCWLLFAAVEIPCGWLWSASAPIRMRLRGASGAPEVDPSKLPSGTSSVPSASLAHIPDHELLRRVGKGGYGEVWLARNAIGILHAVKIIHRRAFESSEPYDREFRGITRFMPISRSHPGFVHVLHVGRDDNAGCFYYVMEIADDTLLGPEIQVDAYSPKSLSSELKRRQRLEPEECLHLGLRLADALSHLHESQLVHRDIKPSNIIFVRGLPKLADIGLVTPIALEPREISFLGTRGYIPPEGPGSPLADIFSLGKVLYEAFTGLDREQFPLLPATILEAPSSLTIELNQVVLRACEPDPRQRYESAADLHKTLETLGQQVTNRLQTKQSVSVATPNRD